MMLILMLTTMTMTIEKISQKSDPSMTFFGEISLNPFEVFLTISIVLIQHNQLKSLKVGRKTLTISQMKPPKNHPNHQKAHGGPGWPLRRRLFSLHQRSGLWQHYTPQQLGKSGDKDRDDLVELKRL